MKERKGTERKGERKVFFVVVVVLKKKFVCSLLIFIIIWIVKKWYTVIPKLEKGDHSGKT